MLSLISNYLTKFYFVSKKRIVTIDHRLAKQAAKYFF